MISSPTKGDELWVFFWLTLVASSSLVFKQNRIVDVRWFGAVVAVSLASMFNNYFAPQQPIYMAVFLKVLLACLAIKTIAERMTISARQIGSVLIRVWISVYIVLIFQAFGLVFKGYELSGFYTMPWMMGSAAVLSIPFIRKMKSWYGVILILPLLLSHSTACIGVALVMWLQPRLKLKYILLVVFLLLTYMFLCDSGLDTARFVVIKKTIPYTHNWIFGDGIGSWAHKAFVRHNGADLYYWRWAHNELYQMTTETGILGGLSVLALISYYFKVISVEQRYYLFGIFALSMVHPIFHIPRLIPFIILIFAVMIRRNSVEC
jgi:hypothetical protein